MEISRENFRAIIFYDFKRGLTEEECINRLQSAFGDKSPSKTTVDDWYAEL